MKTDPIHAKNLAALMRRIRQRSRFEPPEPLEPVTQMVLGFLQWNSTRRAAETAHRRIMDVMVDNNDLRVSYDREIVSLIGEDYPWAEERVARMREALNDIFRREHAVTLDPLAGKPKKEARAYLESLSGMTPYVAAQVTLLCFGGHAIPVDDKLAALLIDEQVVPAQDATPQHVSSFLERHIKASDAVKAHFALQAWVDSTRRRLDATAAGAGMAEFAEAAAGPSATSPGRKKTTRTKVKRKK